jgi:PAS domain S-box-containing protein
MHTTKSARHTPVEHRRDGTNPRGDRERLSLIVEATPVLVAYIDCNYVLTFANEAFARWHGRTPGEITGLPVAEVLGDTAYEAVRAMLEASLAGRKLDFEVSTPHMDKEVRYLQVSYVPDVDEGGRVLGVVASMSDVTESKLAEADLRRREQELRDFIENGAVGLHWVGPDGKILWANRAELQLMGYSEEEYIGRNIAEFHADRPVIEDILRRLSEKETLHSYEARLRAKDGSLKHVLISSNVLWDEEGRFVHTRCFTRDITERKQAEEALRESEERHRAVLEQVSEAIFLLDPDSRRFVVANPAFQRLLGYTEMELLDMTIYDVLPYERERIDRTIQRALESEEYHVNDRLYRRKDGSLVNVEVGITPVSYGGKRVLCQVIRDITERKRIEAQLRANEERFQSLSTCSPVGIFMTDIDGNVTYTNPRCQAICRFSFEEGLGQGWTRFVHPDDRQPALEAWTLAAREGRECSGEFRLRVEEGTDRCVYVRTAPMLSAEGEIIGHVGTVEDISERRLTEEERNQLLVSEQAARADAEEALRMRDELLAIVSHDLKNPLAVIKGNIQLAMRRIEQTNGSDPSRVVSILGRIDDAQAKMNMLINELMDFGRLQAGLPLTLQRRQADLVSLVREVAAEQQHTATRHYISVRADVPELVGWWDAERLERVIANLLSNAIKYSPGGGDITLEVAHESVAADETGEGAETWATVTVRDQGLGISADDMPHIFEWFRRASDVSGRISGAGIGLASSLRAVQQHGGTISAESEPGVGSSFTVRLPVSR